MDLISILVGIGIGICVSSYFWIMVIRDISQKKIINRHRYVGTSYN